MLFPLSKSNLYSLLTSLLCCPPMIFYPLFTHLFWSPFVPHAIETFSVAITWILVWILSLFESPLCLRTFFTNSSLCVLSIDSSFMIVEWKIASENLAFLSQFFLPLILYFLSILPKVYLMANYSQSLFIFTMFFCFLNCLNVTIFPKVHSKSQSKVCSCSYTYFGHLSWYFTLFLSNYWFPIVLFRTWWPCQVVETLISMKWEYRSEYCSYVILFELEIYEMDCNKYFWMCWWREKFIFWQS